MVDRSSILLVVYTAFSEAVIQGLWQQVPHAALVGLVAVCAVLLALALGITTLAARCFGFSKEDEITIVFCGSKKSLASGIPMARVLFASHAGGMVAGGVVVLPLMLFHQMQLMVCAVMAQRYAARAPDRGPRPSVMPADQQILSGDNSGFRRSRAALASEARLLIQNFSRKPMAQYVLSKQLLACGGLRSLRSRRAL